MLLRLDVSHYTFCNTECVLCGAVGDDDDCHGGIGVVDDDAVDAQDGVVNPGLALDNGSRSCAR